MQKKRNIKLTIAYDGSQFSGWQRQKNVPTIQEYLEDILSDICVQKITLHGSGRTDSGVHAKAQVANFLTDSTRQINELMKATNARLPKSIVVKAIEEVDSSFHARFTARLKTYEYYFLASNTRDPFQDKYSWWVGPNWHWHKIEEALKYIFGTHDFISFQSQGSVVDSTVREITKISLNKLEQDLICLTITGTGFLRHMVRCICGTLALVGRQKILPEYLEFIIQSKNRALAGDPAPAKGLYLKEVIY